MSSFSTLPISQRCSVARKLFWYATDVPSISSKIWNGTNIDYSVLSFYSSQYNVHRSSKPCWSVFWALRHPDILVQPFMSSERHFVDVIVICFKIVVFWNSIQCCEYFCFPKGIDKCFHTRNRVAIQYCDNIQFAIVITNMNISVLLWYKHDGQGPNLNRRLGDALLLLLGNFFMFTFSMSGSCTIWRYGTECIEGAPERFRTISCFDDVILSRCLIHRGSYFSIILLKSGFYLSYFSLNCVVSV